MYVQYTNPAGYPPLEHSSRILADRGWEVRFLGTTATGTNSLEFPSHENITVRRWSFCPPGLKQKVHYLLFNMWVIWNALTWRPGWIYASDVLASPAALLLKYLGCRVIYHEHDSSLTLNKDASHSPSDRWLHAMRNLLARRADLCILPNGNRTEAFVKDTGTQKPVITVFNCPRREEAVPLNENSQQVTLYYHGNIGPDLLPDKVIEALSRVPAVRLVAVGYATTGNENHPACLRQRAAELGILERVDLVGPRQRSKLFAMARQCTVGWAAMPMHSRNFNLQTMTGASNKAFDYLACGLALIVSDSREWNEMFVKPGYARACNTEHADSIASALRWFVEHHEEARAMGELGRQRVLREWNYEMQFRSVSDLLTRL